MHYRASRKVYYPKELLLNLHMLKTWRKFVNFITILKHSTAVHLKIPLTTFHGCPPHQFLICKVHGSAWNFPVYVLLRKTHKKNNLIIIHDFYVFVFLPLLHINNKKKSFLLLLNFLCRLFIFYVQWRQRGLIFTFFVREKNGFSGLFFFGLSLVIRAKWFMEKEIWFCWISLDRLLGGHSIIT